MTASILIAQVASVFPIESPPAKEEILYEGAYSGDSELDEIRDFFGGRIWTSITPDDVFRFRHAVDFFSESALIYYTPAWMTCGLLDEEAVDTGNEDLVRALKKMRLNAWTKTQEQAILEWLIYFRDRSPLIFQDTFEQAINNLK
jgi:hypothetical protein